MDHKGGHIGEMDKHQTGLVYNKPDLYESIKNHMERIEDFFKIKRIPTASIMGSSYRLPASLLFKVQVQVYLVFIYTKFNTSNESFCKEKSLGLAECAVSCTKQCTSG